MTISINDFNLFFEVIKATSKIIESAKITVDQNGMTIFGARGRVGRCEIISNSIFAEHLTEFSILDLSMFLKILQTVKDVHENDYTGLKFTVDLPFLKFSSKKFKTKLSTCNEDVIGKWVSKKIEAELVPVFEFTTTSDLIKRVNSHSYVISDADMLRIYLESKSDMENNSLFATIGNKSTELNNEMTLKFGVITFGKLENRELILDLERLNLFNAVQSNSIKVQLMDKNVLVSKVLTTGKNDSYFSLTIYNSLLKN